MCEIFSRQHTRDIVTNIRKQFGSNIKYLEYEPESEKYGGDIYHKWDDALSHSKTEYTQFCTDKEFVFPKVAVDLINYLDLHSDYIAAHGDEYRIIHDEINRLTLTNRQPLRKMETGSDPITRLNDATIGGFSNSLILAMTKTSYLQEIYQTYFNNQKSHDLRYGELYLGFAGHIIGKTYYDSSHISRIRDEITRYDEMKTSNYFFNKSAESSSSRYPTYPEYLKEKMVDTYYNSIRCSFKQLFEKYSSLSNSDIENFLKNNIQLKTVFTSSTNSHLKYLLRNKYLLYIEPLYNKIPPRFRNLITNILNKTCKKRTITSDIKNQIENLVMYPEVAAIMKVVKETEYLKESDKSVVPLA